MNVDDPINPLKELSGVHDELGDEIKKVSQDNNEDEEDNDNNDKRYEALEPDDPQEDPDTDPDSDPDQDQDQDKDQEDQDKDQEDQEDQDKDQEDQDQEYQDQDQEQEDKDQEDQDQEDQDQISRVDQEKEKAFDQEWENKLEQDQENKLEQENKLVQEKENKLEEQQNKLEQEHENKLEQDKKLEQEHENKLEQEQENKLEQEQENKLEQQEDRLDQEDKLVQEKESKLDSENSNNTTEKDRMQEEEREKEQVKEQISGAEGRSEKTERKESIVAPTVQGVRKNKKKIITFYMNCHGEFLGRTLLTSPDFFRNYICQYVVTFQAIRRNAFEEEELKAMKECDIFIYNPVSDKHRIFSYKHVLEHFVNPKARRICIPYYRFKGYWPSLSLRKIGNEMYNKEFEERIILQLDSIMNEGVDNWENKEERLEKLRLIANPVALHHNLSNIYVNMIEYFQSWVNSAFEYFDQLDQLSDIKMLSYLKENWLKIKLFHNYAHPTPIFYVELAKHIFGILGLRRHHQIIMKKKTRSVDEDVILPALKLTLGMTFDEDFHVLNLFYKNIGLYYYLENFGDEFHNEKLEDISRKVEEFYKIGVADVRRQQIIADIEVSQKEEIQDKPIRNSEEAPSSREEQGKREEESIKKGKIEEKSVIELISELLIVQKEQGEMLRKILNTLDS